MATGLLTTQRRMIVLHTILRSWYLFGVVILASGALNRLYIFPRFFTLVHARMEFNKYVLGLVLRMNRQLSNLITGNPATAATVVTSNAEIIEQTYVNVQTQTEDEQELASCTLVPEPSDFKEANSDKNLPLTYDALRHLSQSLKFMPGTLVTPGFSSTNYSAKDLNLLVESLKFAGATGGRDNSDGSSMSRVKCLAMHLKEDIRSLKSLALKL
ncbi:uncharacterized protein V1513DRAFT_451870 [Lipomyces chichibuensis]|uniref:uncharacterized protein n=1 Tax=Lipomyces chichibuensis TaxID=1546026 RepID=UPI003344130E